MKPRNASKVHFTVFILLLGIAGCIGVPNGDVDKNLAVLLLEGEAGTDEGPLENPTAIYEQNIRAGKYQIRPRGESVTPIRASLGSENISAAARLSDGPGSIESIILNIRGIEFVGENGRQVVSSERQTVDLLQLTRDGRGLFRGAIPEGKYEQIRLLLEDDNGKVIASGKEYSLQVPSGAQTGLKVLGPFDFVSGLLISFKLDFRPESIHYNKGQGGYILRPTINIGEVQTSLPFVHGMLLAILKEQVEVGETENGLPRTGNASLDALLADLGAVKIDNFMKSLGFEGLNPEAATQSGLNRMYIIAFKPRADVVLAMFALSKHELVESIEPNHLNEITQTVPGDPRVSLNQNVYFTAIGAYNAWDRGQGNPNIRIAVIDSGVDDTHPDLRGRVIQARGWRMGTCSQVIYSGGGFTEQFFPCLQATADSRPRPEDADVLFSDFSHGTHVAGIIGATANNGMGISGINWKSSVLALHVFDQRVTDDKGVLRLRASGLALQTGIVEAVREWASVINMSLGGDGYQYIDQNGKILFTHTMQHRTVQFAYISRVPIVAGAGNDRRHISAYPGDEQFKGFYPASFPEVISVGALSSNGTARAIWSTNDGSNFGKVDISAPGTAIDSTVVGGGYQQWNGTSMATPIVAGAVSLMLSITPDLQPANIKRHICREAAPIQTDAAGMGCGRLFIPGSLSSSDPTFTKCRQAHTCGQRWFLGVDIDFSATASGGVPPYTWSAHSVPNRGVWGEQYRPPPHNAEHFRNTGIMQVEPRDIGCVLCTDYFTVCVQDSEANETCHGVQFHNSL